MFATIGKRPEKFQLKENDTNKKHYYQSNSVRIGGVHNEAEVRFRADASVKCVRIVYGRTLGLGGRINAKMNF